MNFVNHLIDLFFRYVFAFSLEAFDQVLSADETSVVDIEVMEGESKVLRRHNGSLFSCDRKELGVVDLTIMVIIQLLKELNDLGLRQVGTAEALSNLLQTQSTRVLGIKGPERVLKRVVADLTLS